MREHEGLGVIRALAGAHLEFFLRLDLQDLVRRGLVLDLGELAQFLVLDEFAASEEPHAGIPVGLGLALSG